MSNTAGDLFIFIDKSLGDLFIFIDKSLGDLYLDELRTICLMTESVLLILLGLLCCDYTTVATSWAGTVYPPGDHEFSLVF